MQQLKRVLPEVYYEAYSRYVVKVRRTLENRRGRGQYLLERIEDVVRVDMLSLLAHAHSIDSALHPGLGEEWVVPLHKKAHAWVRLFESLVKRDQVNPDTIVDLLVRGQISIDESMNYAGR